MGYAAAPRVAFIVYGIQTFFYCIVIIIMDAESRHLAHPKHCPHSESDVLGIEQSELSHF